MLLAYCPAGSMTPAPSVRSHSSKIVFLMYELQVVLAGSIPVQGFAVLQRPHWSVSATIT